MKSPSLFFLTAFFMVSVTHLFLAGKSSADPVTIVDQRCVNAPFAKVMSAVTDYSNYSKIPESTLSILGLPILKMLKSQEIRNPSAGSSPVPPTSVGGMSGSSDSIVYIELRPLNFGEDKKQLFPRFFIRCKVNPVSETVFHHECHALTSSDLTEYHRAGAVPQAFGLDGFDSTLEIDGNSSNCPQSGSTQIRYQLTLNPNAQDVKAIQTASGLSAFPLPEDEFFKAYYKGFYNGWVKSIR